VVVSRDWPVPMLVAVTVAPEITAPEGSVTVPVSAPVLPVWPNAEEPEMRSATRQTKNPDTTLATEEFPIIPVPPEGL
jgi:hypothetical protein